MNLRVAEANSVNDEDTGNGSENSDEIEERKRLCRESDGVFTLEDVVHNGGSKELLSEALAIESEGERAYIDIVDEPGASRANHFGNVLLLGQNGAETLLLEDGDRGKRGTFSLEFFGLLTYVSEL